MNDEQGKAELERFTAADHSERFQLLYTYTPTTLSVLIVFANAAAAKPGALWKTRTAKQDLIRRHNARHNSQNRKTA